MFSDKQFTNSFREEFNGATQLAPLIELVQRNKELMELKHSKNAT